MKEMGLQLVYAYLGSLGFAMLFQLRKELLHKASLGGLFSWLVFLLVQNGTKDLFVPCLFGSIFAGAYAECLARKLKAPVILFFVVAVVPLIPGSCLYYTTECIVSKQMDLAKVWASKTLTFAFAISLGIAIIWSVLETYSCIQKRKERNG